MVAAEEVKRLRKPHKPFRMCVDEERPESVATYAYFRKDDMIFRQNRPSNKLRPRSPVLPFGENFPKNFIRVVFDKSDSVGNAFLKQLRICWFSSLANNETKNKLRRRHKLSPPRTKSPVRSIK